MKVAALFLAAFTIVFAMGCSTTGHFRVPDNTALYVYNRPVEVESNGTVTTDPFYWGQGGGILYRLEKGGVVVKEGRLCARFRPVSIFWPPFAFIYWPIGFREDVMYDLINDTQEGCVRPPQWGAQRGAASAPKTTEQKAGVTSPASGRVPDYRMEKSK